MNELPKHEQIKKELAEKFTVNSNYLGSFVKQTIMQTNFKELKEMSRPTEIRKGDVITNYEGVKSRPCVVVKVLKDRTVLYIPLTSSENVHCLSNSKSRFFGEGCFTKSFSVCTEEFAIEHFVGVYDNMTAVNKAIKELKNFLNESL